MKTLAAHQPNYLPWLGLFHKMSRADVFVLADDVQYTTGGYTNRNRIRTADGWSWLTVPVRTKGRAGQTIGQVELVDDTWQRKHWQAIRHAYHEAPHFASASDALESFYTDRVWTMLFDVNVELIGWLATQLSIAVEIRRTSEFDLPQERTDRLVALAQACGCDTYLAGEGGSRQYLEPSRFDEAGVALAFTAFEHPTYEQGHEGFEAGMAAIDALFHCGPAAAQLVREGAHA